MPSSRPSVYDVASAAGVSTASVSRYFRSPEKVSEHTRDRIRHAVAELGYLPSGLARGLAEQRTGSIGLYSFSGHEADEWEHPDLTPSGSPPPLITEHERRARLYPLFADEVLHGVELECTLRRLPLAVGWQATADRGVSIDDIALRSDGLIILPSTIDDGVLRLLSRRMPLVLVSQTVPAGMSASSVRVDDFGGMHAITSHLADQHGATSFAFAGSAAGAEHEARFAGFAQALRERGIQVPEATLVETGSRSGTTAAVTAMFTSGMLSAADLPDAVVCSSDQTALGVLVALEAHGIEVPTRVAVTGFDGIDAGRFVTPSLTTVRQPMDELGRAAVTLLADLLHDGGATRDVVLPVSVVLRRSCGCGLGERQTR